MIFRYVDHLRSKRYTVAVPDGSTIRDTPAGQVVTLPRAGLLPSLTFLSIPKFADEVTILAEEPLTEGVPDYLEGEADDLEGESDW